MKNRKFLLTILSLAVILVSLLGFSGCSEEHTHSFSDWVSVVEPTCTSFGVQKRTCACEHTEYKTTAALQHTPVVDASIDATCTSAGKTEGSHCDICKTILVAQTDTAPVPHSFSDWVSIVEPTCTSFGVQKRTCVCEHTEYKTTAALQHTPVVDAPINATCTSTGKTEGSHCDICKAVLVAQTDTAPVPHSFSDWVSVVEPTCTSFGVQKRTCACEHTEYKTTAALQHTPVVDAPIDATCTTDGKTEGSHCSTCRTILTIQNTISAFGHCCDNISVLQEADCNVEGCKRFSCSNTGCSYYYDESYSKEELSAPEIMESAMGYVGYLKTYTHDGVLIKDSTAFVISADGKLITSYAALNDAYYATFTIGEKTYDIVEILAYDNNINMAVLKIDATDLTYATICESAPVTAETVYSIGNALGLSLAINEGIVSNASLNSGDIIYIQHDAILMSGYGGGPLLNRFGEVIGVNFGTYQDEHFRLASPITQLSALNYDNPISMEENFNLTCTIKERLSKRIMELATGMSSGSYYLEQTSSRAAFALGYNEPSNYIFVASEMLLENGYSISIYIPLERVKDGNYQYEAIYTDGKYRSEIFGFFDPATYADPNTVGSHMLTYDTFHGRYWDEQSVMDACSLGTYETLRWLSYCLDAYFFDISLKDTFGFTALSYEYDDTALEKLNHFVEANGAFNSETGAYLYSTSQNLTGATIMYGIHYYPASEENESKTIVTIYCASANGEVYSVSITLNPRETGNLIELFSGLWNDADQLEVLNTAWGYIDANSFTDTSEIACYVFEGYEEYEDKLLAYYSSLIPYLLGWVDTVMSDVEPVLSIRDLGFLFYLLP